MTTADDRGHGVPSAGTLPLRDPEQVFRTVSGLLQRLFAGETGHRWDWVSIRTPARATDRLPAPHPALPG